MISTSSAWTFTIVVWSNSHMTDRPQASAVRQEVTVVTAPWHTYTAFGITWKTDIPWPEPTAETGEQAADVLVQLVDETEIVRRWSGGGEDPTWLLRIDGLPLVVERGLHGDFRLSHESGLFHVDADGTSVACATSDPNDPWWLRLVLDTILWSTALLRGVEALHASAVATEHGVVAFIGPTGSGKTTLALEFLRRGYSLFCDDVLALRTRPRESDGLPFATLPQCADWLEIRQRGADQADSDPWRRGLERSAVRIPRGSTCRASLPSRSRARVEARARPGQGGPLRAAAVLSYPWAHIAAGTRPVRALRRPRDTRPGKPSACRPRNESE